MSYGLQPGMELVGKSRDISNTKPVPNWDLIDRSHLSDDEFLSRVLMLEKVQDQMLKSAQRRLVPESDWENLVLYSVYKSATTWKGNGEGRAPIKNYAWRILHNISCQWWKKYKHTILDSVCLDG